MGCGASTEQGESLAEASMASKRALSQLREYETKANLLASGGTDTEPTQVKFSSESEP